MSSFRPCALIPVYNHERAVRKVIDRLLPLNLEIIMVDDGSSKACAQVLDALEHDKKNRKINDLADDLPLFASVQKKVTEEEIARISPLEEALKAVNPDNLTPREALEKLYELKTLI